MDASGNGAINVYEHGTVLDRSRGKVACNYCGKVVSGSFRLKCHIGEIRGDVLPCPSAPADVKELMRNKLLERKREKLGTEFQELDQFDRLRKRNCSSSSNGVKHNKPETTRTSSSQSGNEEEMEFSLEDFWLEDGAIGHVPVHHGSRGSKKGGSEETKTDMVSRQALKCIGRFFYETGLEFSAVNSCSFRKMIHSTLRHGQVEYKLPSSEDLKGWILKDEVKEMQEYVNKVRKSWATTGCSILIDGWIDGKGRNLVNFLVNCPQGTIYLCTHDMSAFKGNIGAIYSLLEGIIEDVGVENVVQIVADSTTGWAGTVGKDFNDRCKGVFWAVSASHCIGMILEKIGRIGSIRGILGKAKVLTKFIHGHATVLQLLKKHTLGRDLVKPSKIRSAMPYMTLENIVSEKQELKEMFSSSEWIMSTWASRAEGKRVADLVNDNSFWTGAGKVLKAVMPLIRIIELIFKAEKPLVGYIYETMDQVKEAIKKELQHKESQYLPIWELIDEIWDNHLHSPLHAAGYYLNPSLYYARDFFGDEEVALGIVRCLVQMVQNQSTQDSITLQFGEYKNSKKSCQKGRATKGSFQEGKAKDRRTNVPPAMWWSCYGGKCPELQRFAIRIVSQDCDGAAKYGLKRALADKLLTDGRNPIEQQRLKDLTFVHYNLQLQQFCSGVKSGIAAEEIDPMDDWITDEAPDIVSANDESSWMNLDRANRANNEEGPSRFQNKTEPV